MRKFFLLYGALIICISLSMLFYLSYQSNYAAKFDSVEVIIGSEKSISPTTATGGSAAFTPQPAAATAPAATVLVATEVPVSVQATTAPVATATSSIGSPTTDNTECAIFISNVAIDQRVMSQSESQAVRVRIRNDTIRTLCTTEVRLLAPQFDSAPQETQFIELGSFQERTIPWVIAPKQSGNYTIIVVAGDTEEVIGISVTDIFGLTPLQSRTISTLGTVLGISGITMPWLFEKFRKKTDKPLLTKPTRSLVIIYGKRATAAKSRYQSSRHSKITDNKAR